MIRKTLIFILYSINKIIATIHEKDVDLCFKFRLVKKFASKLENLLITYKEN